MLQRKPRARSAQVAAAEFREDYTVKTFIGHTEGVLCIACDPTTVYSGSWFSKKTLGLNHIYSNKTN